MAKHSELTSIHRIYNWTYADETAREAATGMVPADVGKLARQLDDDSLWMLTDDDPVTWVAIGGGGGGSAAAAVRAKRASGDVALSTTYAQIQFNAEDYDTSAFHDNSTAPSRFTAPSTGKYHISVCGYCDVACIASILKNGTTAIAVGGSSLAVIAPINIAIDCELSAGDYVELQIKTTTGTGNLLYDANVSPIFCMHSIG